MSNSNNNKGLESFKILSFVLPLIFYIGIAVLDGPVWCVDSQSYVSMDFSREPVYPLFWHLSERYLKPLSSPVNLKDNLHIFSAL